MKASPARRTKRKRQYTLESLESRTLLTFTFVYTNVNLAVVNETGPGNDSFTVANNGTGLLEWSTDHGATFSTQWGAVPADTLNAEPRDIPHDQLGGQQFGRQSSAFRQPGRPHRRRQVRSWPKSARP